MDGDADLSALSRVEIEQALARIDKRKSPADYQRLLRELDIRSAETAQRRSASSVDALITRYSVYLSVAYLVMLTLAVTGVLRSRGLTSAVEIITVLVLYVHLAWNHPDKFLQVAIWVSLIGCTAGATMVSISSRPKSIQFFVGALLLNFVMVGLVGTVLSLKQLKPPSNNRWRGP